ncbi:TlpA family protein disulfide reductase [Parafilimonas sp.]|uniref:TlpA family protein disulfide reductase n=1 Tax=Parafilimonas sp. TaxID=1969739 RepID=UPI003F7CD766
MDEQENHTKKWRQFIKTNFINGLLVVATVVLIFSPDAKAFLIKGLMQIGFFKPGVEKHEGSYPMSSNAVFTDSSGKATSIASLNGKVIFINFWATWCPPCRAELPSINKMYQRFGTNKNIVFLLVDADGNIDNSNAFMKDHNYKLPLFISSSNISQDLFSGTLPTTIVINKKGQIVFKETGAADYSTASFTDFITKLAAE